MISWSLRITGSFLAWRLSGSRSLGARMETGKRCGRDSLHTCRALHARSCLFSTVSQGQEKEEISVSSFPRALEQSILNTFCCVVAVETVSRTSNTVLTLFWTQCDLALLFQCHRLGLDNLLRQCPSLGLGIVFRWTVRMLEENLGCSSLVMQALPLGKLTAASEGKEKEQRERQRL